MGRYWIWSLFLMLSFILIVLCVDRYSDKLYKGKFEYQGNREKTTKIVGVKCKKLYPRKRKEYIEIRTLEIAQSVIDKLLVKKPILFLSNSSKVDLNTTKIVLNQIVKIINHLDEDAILSISTHTDIKGSKQYNLQLSQRRADVLKDYFRQRTQLSLIVSIGYGEEIGKRCRVKIELKRIK